MDNAFIRPCANRDDTARFGFGLVRPVALVAALAAALVMAACGTRTVEDHRPPVEIKDTDTCAVCGMYVKGSTGPRAEAYAGDAPQPLKFESTRDLLAYAVQPDLAAQLGAVYVQDTARIDWQNPGGSPASFTDARTAFYVAWQPLPGGMGPTFASFAKRADAEAFVAAHGGQIMSFGEITPELVSQLQFTCPPPGSALAKLAHSCKTVAGAAVTQAGSAHGAGEHGSAQ
ncbi:nitrous oxide reductase accessory protein NosL [Trinickia caryophylli]|uniref:Copper chaperone NosL n=1 Tax=Trinickia caryophylli TaxID=28094 RepID=A0A1X7FAP5_TRICW|nr:nitrous oxide reductase accessory protein NosL [Trinickia caryophylli]PMS10945.1 nitrous oxide reductase [Trinickia caryophylli]TRX18892.1 nitrous oxide reductase [Trinickia caryophylli]WQE10310.1 nitrous oxide reductase accessory protein NosL [Trinickia caryophylli]SMF49045.1 copper chaperone NosL [Trinickia caryophylli]GLU34243.1 hypothetical protein Busp01_40850 [Trinickia caryophylli]